MNIRLDSRRRRLAFVSAISLVAVLFAGTAARLALTQFWGESGDADRMALAVSLDAGNPELHYWLATANLVEGRDLSDAVSHLRRSVQLNSRPAKYWLALGRACFAAGDEGCAEQSFEQAVQRAPMMPSLEGNAAAYHAVVGNTERMLAHASRGLELDPASAGEVFTLVWHSTQDPEVLWTELAGKSKSMSVRDSYVDFVTRLGRFDLVAQHWKQAGGASRPGLAARFETVRPYLQGLMAARRYHEALLVWSDLLRQGVVSSRQPGDGNLLFNGGFEQPILNAGFDWQTREYRYVTVEFPSCPDGQRTKGDRRCLRMEFTAPHNVEEEPVWQVVPVSGGRLYRLSARIRSDAITSDSGPRLRVHDVLCPHCLDASTEPVVGTQGWHDASLTFRTGEQIEFIAVSVWRPRSRVFPMDISGVLWLDSVSLLRVPE